ncbi:peptidoglycan editing factor PgeF [uncultured Draconibacterium sp.]|uniref:peptidoglycan editing factor PgeF n=1 Tax=uncultured Draconibacterium sp. TaxID=1573823 RepID=UPI0025FE3F6A|nr:peptidoglycan editing factor PgeF [uncultured Draconibacterium sp.]
MDKFVRYQLFKPYQQLMAFTTTKHTLPVKNIRYSHNPQNKEKLALALQLQTKQLVFPDQTHSSCVAEINTAPSTKIAETDALVSNKPGLCLCVQTADCVPLLLFDPEAMVIAAVHAGWRGTVGRIVEKALESMVANFGASAKNTIVVIGPSVGPAAYEVGSEVVAAAHINIPQAEKTLHKNGSGKFHFNLWEANRQLLLKNGVQEHNIEVLKTCSFSESEKYFSARRDGVETGRMVSGIMLKA